MPTEADMVCNHLLRWRQSADYFLRWTKVDGNFFVDTSVIKGSPFDGMRIPVASVMHERSLLARTICEARRRSRQGEWSWFYWLSLYGDLIATGIRATFADEFDGVINRSGKQQHAIKKRNARHAISMEMREKILQHHELYGKKTPRGSYTDARKQIAKQLGISMNAVRQVIEGLPRPNR